MLKDDAEFIKSIFEDSYCSTCGGSAQHHVAVTMVNASTLPLTLAVCLYPPLPFTGADLHPVIQEFRAGATS